MSLLGRLNKLRRMPAEEIRFRLRQKWQQEREKWILRRADGHPRPELFWPSWVVRVSADLPTDFPDPAVQFFALSADPDTLRTAFQQYFPGQQEKILQRAEKLFNHQFHFLGLDVSLPQPIDWNRNPQTGKAYPLRHFSQIPLYDTARFGDVKYVWELNRHQFFIELARAYLLSGDERYVQKIWDWFSSWVQQNPYKMGVNWTSALEAAVRIFSWLWSFYFTASSPWWTAERRQQLLQALLLQAAYIEENLSYYFSPYNHLIGELAALAFLGTVVPGLPRARDWQERYWQELVEQLPEQFHADGFTVEQASYYHHFTWGFYYQVALLRRQNGLPVENAVWEWLERSLEIILFMTRPDGEVPRLGDIDNARSIYFGWPENQWDLRAFQALGAVQFHREDMCWRSDNQWEEVLWLHGPQALRTLALMPVRPPEAHSVQFPASGYLIWRSGWGKKDSYLLFDVGPIAAGLFPDQTPSAAHGHADILHLEVVVQGQPLLVDPGFYTYFGPLRLHRYFRSTHGHNLPEVDGHGQARHENRLGWSCVAQPHFYGSGQGNGYRVAGGRINHFSELEGVFHQRLLIWKEAQYLLILDWLAEEQEHSTARKAEFFWHFPPGQLQWENGVARWNKNWKVYFASSPPATVDLQIGQQGNPGGWFAPGYGSMIEAPLLKCTIHGALPVLAAALIPFRQRSRKIPALECTLQEGIGRCRICWGPQEDEFLIGDGSRPLPSDAGQARNVLLLGRLAKTPRCTVHFAFSDAINGGRHSWPEGWQPLNNHLWEKQVVRGTDQ